MASWTGLAAYILGFGSVEDSDAKILEAAGFAKTFGMYSIWHQQFSGKYGVDKGVALFDDYKYTWGDIKCSRAPKGQWHSFNLKKSHTNTTPDILEPPTKF